MDVKKIIVQKLCESGLSRVEQWMDMHDIACISACRTSIKNVTQNTNSDDVARFNDALEQFKTKSKDGKSNGEGFEGVMLTPKENKLRTRDLKSKLLTMGYGVTSIGGNYIEGYGKPDSYEVAESSFFVVNLNNDSNFFENITKLSEYFNQDSVLLKPKGEKAFLYGTNTFEFPGFHEKSNEKDYHALPGRFMSRVRKAAFSFANQDALVMRKNKNDVRDGDEDDYEHEFLWLNDERPIKTKNVGMSEACRNKFNSYIDNRLIETINSYDMWQRQAIGSCSQRLNEGLKRTGVAVTR